MIDTSNPIAVRDGHVEFLDLPDGLTAAQRQQRTLGDVRLVKAFNAICASEIDKLAERTDDERAAIRFAGDDPPAELVDVFVDMTTIQVWSKNHLIKTVARTRCRAVRKIRADGLHVKHQPDTKRQASAGT